jgi:hypothetical protein
MAHSIIGEEKAE